MNAERSLWDAVEAGEPEVPVRSATSAYDSERPAGSVTSLAERKDRPAEDADKEETRKGAIKRLRASGHWLTLLRVARTIPQPFTLNDISVAVWRDCPEFFGMKGYPYPDNHKVHYILYGDRGLIAKGMIERVGQGVFRLPENLNIDQMR